MCPDAAEWTQVQGVGGAPTLGGCFQGVWARLHPAAAHRREICVVRGLCGGSGYQGSGRRCPEHPLVRSVLNGSSHVGEAGKATSPQGHGPGQPRSHCHGLCHGWMRGGDGDFGLGGSPSPARQDARLPRTVPLECRHRRAELQRQQLHVSRQVCGHQPAPGPLTACFQLQPEQGSVPPHHTTPAPALPCLPGAPCSGTTEPVQAPPGCGSTSQHIRFPVFSSASLYIHFQTPVST